MLRDDRILPFTRVVAAAVIVVLVFAFIVLFLLPGQTDRRFAWTIHPSMTAMLMGAGYGSAIYFFVRVLTERQWHRVGLGFLPITVFTWMMLGTTFLHWGRFRHGSFPFDLWFWIYLVTPVLVPAVWLVNRRHDPGTVEARDARFEVRVRRALVATGLVLVAIAAWMYIDPEGAVAVWPWGLTTLTARVIAAFVALPGVGWHDFHHANVLTYVYFLGLVGTLAAIATLRTWMLRRIDAGDGVRSEPEPTA
ncbi:MAG: hypothetical protein E6G54_00945 [Actinobacteria bacterium]|nr:MAG: hypothetical protein E6G54_00945 [Actinomycetota bacterium]